MRKLLLAIIALLSLALCLGMVGIGYLMFSSNRAPQIGRTNTTAVLTTNSTGSNSAAPTAKQVFPLKTPTRSVAGSGTTSPGAGTPAAPSNGSTLDLLLANAPPPNNAIQLAQEYKRVEPIFPTPAAPKQYKVGDKEQFWVTRDILTSKNEQATATLRYMNDVVYMWVEDGERLSDQDLKIAADVFANEIYPDIHNTLGSENTPGIDNDPRLHILHARFDNNSTAGYFSYPDTLPQAINAQSNERELFYINARVLEPDEPYYLSVLAHEFTHMAHDNQNKRGESSWLTEGFGEIGVQLAGYMPGHVDGFIQDPDLQLDAWGVLSGPHYGKAYLFLAYQLHRFGVEYIRDIFSSNKTGIASVQYALDKHNTGLTFDELFADWVAANFINNPALGERYSYYGGPLVTEPTESYSSFPTQASAAVTQYGTDYIQLLPGDQDLTFSFDGADTVQVIPTEPYSGSHFWWGDRTDFSDTTLTRAVDLSKVSAATLKFRTWYDIEADYDYAYVSASTDGGKTWTTLEGKSTTTRDPNAANYGNGFTCKSGAGCADDQGTARWIQEEMDLTAYAGKSVLLRFQQVTDPVLAEPGFAIDDIEIPEIGFFDDAEDVDSGWDAKGFVRIDNILPQRFIVQAIEFGSTPRVVPITLDSENRGTYTTAGLGPDVSRVVIAVSGSTPITWETAPYQFQIQ